MSSVNENKYCIKNCLILFFNVVIMIKINLLFELIYLLDFICFIFLFLVMVLMWIIFIFLFIIFINSSLFLKWL